MPALHLHRLFFRPQPTANRFGEPVPACPCIDNAVVRQTANDGAHELCMSGHALVGTANGPLVTIDGIPAPCVCFEADHLVATIPPGTGPRIRVLVTYGTLVSGDFLIRNSPGARVHRWAIRIDDRFRDHARAQRS